jgi:exosortase
MCSVNYTAQPVAAVAPPVGGIFNPASLWRGAILGLLISWLYAPILVQLAAQWWHDPNFSHGFLVPLFSLFLLWKDRVRILKLSAVPSSWGLLIIIFALCLLLAGVLGAELFLSRISLLVLLAGLIIFLRGWPLFRAVLFPWAFLFLMIPIPAIIFNQITFPLQLLASKLAASILPLLGVPVLREGNIINLPAMPLEVAEACSGIRSLLSLATLSIVYGYLMESRIWIRVLLAIASIPIAVAANSLRIVGTGLLVQYWGQDAAEGFFHTFSGWLVFVVSLILLFAVHELFVLAAGPIEEQP